MADRLIALVEVLVDRIEKNGYQHRALEDDIYAEKEKRAAAEKDRDHWKAARQDAIEAGELMQAEIETLRKQLADAQREASDEFTERQVLTAEQEQDAEIWRQRFDWAQSEVKYLRERLDEERSVSARFLRKLAELDANSSATLNSSVVKNSLSTEAEGE